jgi:hypothetical protein
MGQWRNAWTMAEACGTGEREQEATGARSRFIQQGYGSFIRGPGCAQEPCDHRLRSMASGLWAYACGLWSDAGRAAATFYAARSW